MAWIICHFKYRQYVSGDFDARLSDDEVRKLVEPAVISEIDQLRLRARELNIKGEIDRMKLATLQKKIAEAEAAEAENA